MLARLQEMDASLGDDWAMIPGYGAAPHAFLTHSTPHTTCASATRAKGGGRSPAGGCPSVFCWYNIVFKRQKINTLGSA
jgi:hypothetical protein